MINAMYKMLDETFHLEFPKNVADKVMGILNPFIENYHMMEDELLKYRLYDTHPTFVIKDDGTLVREFEKAKITIHDKEGIPVKKYEMDNVEMSLNLHEDGVKVNSSDDIKIEYDDWNEILSRNDDGNLE